MITQNLYNLYDIIYEDLSRYEKYHPSDAIIRKRKAASMFTTYFSILNRLPESILEYALIMSSSLWLSALLCFEDTSYYPNYVLDYFFVDNGSYWAHEESEEPEIYFKLLGPYNGTTQQFISEFNRLEYQSVFDVCEVLGFHLLF